MTVAKIMNPIARQLDCAGRVVDAVSVYIQVKMDDAPKLLKIPKVRMSRFMDSSSTTQVAEIMVKHWNPVVLLERNLCGHRFAGLLWERQFEVLGTWMVKKYHIGKVCLFIANVDSCRYMWMTSKWLDEDRIWVLCWRNRWNSSTLENPHHLLTTYLGCLWSHVDSPGGAMNVADASETSGRKLVNGTWSESNSTWCVDSPSTNGTPTPWDWQLSKGIKMFQKSRVTPSVATTLTCNLLVGVPRWLWQKTRIFLSIFVDDINMSGTRQNLEPMWKKFWSWRTDDISWPRIFGKLSKWMHTKWDHYGAI